jgi:hypothetical protein
MSDIFTIRQGNRAPYLFYKFPFSLATAVGVTFSARELPSKVVFIDRQPAQIANGTYTIDGKQVALTPADGVAFYPWGPTDTTTVRKSCSFLFHITWPGNLSETLPSEGGELMRIWENF